MKKQVTFILMLFFTAVNSTLAQSNFINKYITDSLTFTIIGDTANQINQPRDLDFKPNTNELWVCNYGTSNGGDMVIFFGAGTPSQSSEHRKDSHTSHFMAFPSAIAFSNEGKWASTGEIQSTGGPTSTFMGPSLWSSDTSIFATVFQSNWVGGLPLGSHLDMLHQSPYAMGIAHDSAMVYYVMDGWNGNICRYDYVQHHGPGYEDHSHGKIWRYTDVSFTRVPDVPSHCVLDRTTGWLYFIDGGTKTIKRMNVNSGSITGNLTPPNSGFETLTSYQKIEGATVEVIDTLTAQPCGIDFYNDRLVVTDYDSGYVYIYSTNPTPTLLGTFQTGHTGNMGVKIGTDGRIWFVNFPESKVYRIDPSGPDLDLSVQITGPITFNNYNADYYSTLFNVCGGNLVFPSIVKNNGATTITSFDVSFSIDGGTPVLSNYTGAGLAPNASTTVTSPMMNIPNGSHFLSIQVSNINGQVDDIPQNNFTEGSFRIIDPVQQLPFMEDFTIQSFPPAGWNYVHFNPNCQMDWNQVGGFGLSLGCMRMDNFTGAEDITGQKDYFISPRLNFTNTTSAVEMTFDVAYAQYNSTSNDELQISASTDCGNTWNVVYDKAGSSLITAPPNANAFTPNSTQWRNDTVNLAAYATQPEVLFMFTAISNFGNNLFIDNINIADISLGITTLNSNENFNVYPNPVSDNELILNSTAFNNSNINYVISNMIGQQLTSGNGIFENGKLKIDVSNIKAGSYFLKVIEGDQTFVSKIIKL